MLIDGVFQDSSPVSEMTRSPCSKASPRTGKTEPWILARIVVSRSRSARGCGNVKLSGLSSTKKSASFCKKKQKLSFPELTTGSA
jgi:hypothetical protein